MNHCRTITGIRILIILTALSALGQVADYDRRIKDKSSELKSLRSEINGLGKELSRTRRSEQDAISLLNKMDQQISLIKQLRAELRQERELKEAQISLLQATVEANQDKIASLRQRYARRVSQIYKSGTQEDWQLIFSADGLQQAFQRLYYLKAIHQAEAHLLVEIRQTLRDTDAAKAKLELRLSQVAANLKEEAATENELKSRQNQKSSELGKIRRNKSGLQQELKQKRSAARELEGIIARLEKEKQIRLAELARRRGTTKRQAATKFSSMKGHLPWPATGKITAKFGLQRNTRLKTVTDNPGIDIAAQKGAPVKVVLDGIVVSITWIPGFGNTLIVDHGGGFYSVYAHVEDVKINVNDYVVGGEAIAAVGNSGSFDGYKLHFEIWAENNKLNPLQWLKR